MPTPNDITIRQAFERKLEVSAVDLAPDYAHDFRNTFIACLCGDGSWGIDQVSFWTDRNGEQDSEGCGIAYGLSEAEARGIVDRLSGSVLARAA